MLGVAERSLCRGVFRECRRLAADWSPSPPAFALLWGQAHRIKAGILHPMLSHPEVAPRCVQPFLRPVRAGGPHFVKQLRTALRSSSDKQESLSIASDGAKVKAFLERQRSLAACTSNSEAKGLHLQAVSGYVQRDVNAGQNVFSYNMRFENRSQRRYRLLARQYDFHDSDGISTQVKPEQIEAAGVVGYTPLIEPGEVFEFGSGCAIKSERGHATGRFLIMVEPEGLSAEDARFHENMETAELFLRLVYYKGLATEQFYVPLEHLRLDKAVQAFIPSKSSSPVL